MKVDSDMNRKGCFKFAFLRTQVKRLACQNDLRTSTEKISELTSNHERIQLEMEEKVYDLKIAQKNIKKLTEMLDENNSSTESQQQERLQNIVGKFWAIFKNKTGYHHDPNKKI